MSIEENLRKSNPQANAGETETDPNFLERDFDIVPIGNQPVSFRKYLFGLTALLLIASASFGLGRLSRLEETRKPVVIRQPESSGMVEEVKASVPSVSMPPAEKSTNSNTAAAITSVKSVIGPESVVGSKNGKKYHFPWCSGAKRIIELNKVVFATTDEARKAGYTPAANCKGLK